MQHTDLFRPERGYGTVQEVHFIGITGVSAPRMAGMRRDGGLEPEFLAEGAAGFHLTEPVEALVPRDRRQPRSRSAVFGGVEAGFMVQPQEHLLKHITRFFAISEDFQSDGKDQGRVPVIQRRKCFRIPFGRELDQVRVGGFLGIAGHNGNGGWKFRPRNRYLLNSQGNGAAQEVRTISMQMHDLLGFNMRCFLGISLLDGKRDPSQGAWDFASIGVKMAAIKLFRHGVKTYF